MIRIQLMDGSSLEIPREEAVELLAYRDVFVNPRLKSPFEGLFVHRGKIVPLLGPMPPEDFTAGPTGDRAWILLLKGCAQVALGMPEFIDAESQTGTQEPGPENNQVLLQELDDLLKAA